MSHKTTSGGGRRRRCALQLDQPARAQCGAQGGAQIGAGAAPVGGETAGRDVLDRQAQPRDRRLGAGQLLQRHFLEIHPAQLLAVGEAHRRVDLGLGLLGLARLLVRVQRLGEAPHHRRALSSGISTRISGSTSPIIFFNRSGLRQKT